MVNDRSRPKAAPETCGGVSTQSTDLAARARRHDFAVRVLAERRDGVVVAQVYADLPAAERKVARTRERGLSAQMHLVRLVPVGVTPLPVVCTAEQLADLVDGAAR